MIVVFVYFEVFENVGGIVCEKVLIFIGFEGNGIVIFNVDFMVLFIL